MSSNHLNKLEDLADIDLERLWYRGHFYNGEVVDSLIESLERRYKEQKIVKDQALKALKELQTLNRNMVVAMEEFNIVINELRNSIEGTQENAQKEKD
jgi:hypothetical protein